MSPATSISTTHESQLSDSEGSSKSYDSNSSDSSTKKPVVGPFESLTKRPRPSIQEYQKQFELPDYQKKEPKKKRSSDCKIFWTPP